MTWNPEKNRWYSRYTDAAEASFIYTNTTAPYKMKPKKKEKIGDNTWKLIFEIKSYLCEYISDLRIVDNELNDVFNVRKLEFIKFPDRRYINNEKVKNVSTDRLLVRYNTNRLGAFVPTNPFNIFLAIYNVFQLECFVEDDDDDYYLLLNCHFIFCMDKINGKVNIKNKVKYYFKEGILTLYDGNIEKKRCTSKYDEGPLNIDYLETHFHPSLSEKERKEINYNNDYFNGSVKSMEKSTKIANFFLKIFSKN